MSGVINFRTDANVSLEELNKLEGLTAVATEINDLIDGRNISETPPAAGIEFTDKDGNTYISAYNETGGDISAAGTVVTLGYSNDYGVEAIAVATTSFPVRTAVSLGAVSEHDLAWFQVGGEAEAGVEGTSDVAAGDFLEVLNGESAFKKDGSSRTTVSAAVAVDAQSENEVVVVTVRLINEQHTIAGS